MPLLRFYDLQRERRAMLVRAIVALTASSAAVAILPFRWAMRFGAAKLATSSNGIIIQDAIWAIEAAARRLPWRTMCIEKGLALQRILRSKGLDAVLHYGVRHEPDMGRLQAHVWVSVGEAILIGGDEAADFAEITTFP